MVPTDFLTLSGRYVYGNKTIMDTQAISTNDSRSDIELMEAVFRRESDAIQEIYKRYKSSLCTVIQNVLHDDVETDDTLNDVFLQLWDNADRFDPAKGLHGFLVTMARRRALDRLRRRIAYRRATDRFEAELQANSDEPRVRHFEPANSDLADLLHGVIHKLPIPQQEVINLTFFEGLSQREIAARKSIALGTVKTRLQLAQKKLFDHLAPVQAMI
ncbi:MAG: sigma-70 family RNA polymerase sigma factor [Verrucomicrobia bacterium]|nr:sigma-70 family RNA polymerase sigma factor [Verrucomicrobiota bacterium]